MVHEDQDMVETGCETCTVICEEVILHVRFLLVSVSTCTTSKVV